MWILWLKKIPREIWYLLGIIGLLWYVDHRGYQRCKDEWDASRERGREILSRLKERQITITKGVLVKREVEQKLIYVQGKTIIREIPKYIPIGTPDLPYGFRLLHDAAVAGTLPESSEGVNGETVPVTTATETIAGNYTTCRAAIADLNLLRSWVQEQRQAYLAECKRLGDDCNKDN